MKIYKKNKAMVKETRLIKSFFKQVLGLRFSRQRNLIFEFKKERKEIIDMFFVFYPIDLVFLNNKKEVVELKNNLKPFSVYNSKNKAKYILEFKKNTIKDNRIKLGDKLSF